MAKGKYVQFKTRRKKLVRFKLTGRGHKHKTPWMRKLGAAGKACRNVGKVGSAKNVACIKAKLAK